MDINVYLFYFFNHGFQNPIFDAIMPIITNFGDFFFLLAALFIVIIYARFKNKESLKRIAIIAFCAVLAGGLIAYSFKYVFLEPRPYDVLPDVRLLLNRDHATSFPSGHSAAVWAFVTILLLNMKDLAKKHYKIISVCLVVYAFVIMFSRLYCGMHYPFDILAGAVIGIVAALIVNKFQDNILSIIKI